MASRITFFADDETRHALADLTADGTLVQVAIRNAIIEAAVRNVQKRAREEAEALAAEENDRAEAAQVLRDMETSRAW